MTRQALYVLMFSFLIFLAALGTGVSEEINKDFHQSFSVKGGDTLSLRFGDGDVKIIPWEKSAIDVNVRYRADIDIVGIRLGGKQDFDVEFRQTASTVYVIGKEPDSATIGYQNKKVYEYAYEIHSPDYIKLDLEGDDGDVGVENWAAEIECHIDDGNVHLKNVAGKEVSIWGEDGDVEIDNLTGDLTIELDDGEVILRACDMERCRVDSEDGDVTISQSKGSFDITVDDSDVIMEKTEAKGLNIRSMDGNIDLELIGKGILDADISTDDGDVTVGLDRGFSISFYVSADDARDIRLALENIEDYKEDEHVKSGSINGGTGRLKIRTHDGRVRIEEK